MPRESFDSEDSSSDGLDDLLYKDLPKRTTERKKRVPNRYGSTINQNISSDESDLSCSEKEPDYVPPTKKQKCELLSSHGASIVPSTRKAKSTAHSTDSNMHAFNGGVSEFFELTSVSLTDWDFNSEFEALAAKETNGFEKKSPEKSMERILEYGRNCS